MSNEDTMRQEFRKLHPNSEMQEQFAEAWKACAAIKDAEIADITQRKDKYFLEMCKVIEKNEKLLEEIASRDLMIKELREIIEKIAFMGMDKPMQADGEYFYQSQLRNCIAIAAQALSKSEHHNSRALEKMLLEARIEALTEICGTKRADSCISSRDYMSGFNAKAKEVNRALTVCKAKLSELNRDA